MALYSLRFRKTLLPSLNCLLNHRHHRGLSIDPSISSSPVLQTIIPSLPSSSPLSTSIRFQSRSFRSSAVSLSSRNYNDDGKISPDTILFEGCDYNHWLITMDFPKDPKPTAEEMVRTYEETCAKGLGITVEEAKKRMYACSTTTYQGFQAIMTEQESEKFKGVDGVVFILPDSYIDPVNKEYGGDKYINGTIIPRPPPVRYERSRGRYADRNRNRDGPMYDQQGGSMSNRLGNPPYDRHGPMHGDGRSYGVPNSPQQNFRPSSVGGGDALPVNNMNYMPGGSERAINRGQGDYNTQEQRDFSQGDQRGFVPPYQNQRGDPRGDARNFAPQQSGSYGQGTSGAYGQRAGGGFGQGAGGSYGQGAGSGYGQGAGGSYGQGAGSGYGQGAGGSYGQSAGSGYGAGGSYGQGAGSGYGQGAGHGQGAGNGQGAGPNYGQGTSPNYGQGAGSNRGQDTVPNYGQGYSGHVETQRIPQVEQRSNPSLDKTGTDQGRY